MACPPEGRLCVYRHDRLIDETSPLGWSRSYAFPNNVADSANLGGIKPVWGSSLVTAGRRSLLPRRRWQHVVIPYHFASSPARLLYSASEASAVLPVHRSPDARIIEGSRVAFAARQIGAPSHRHVDAPVKQLVGDNDLDFDI
jgi:hypothetical protein